MIVAAIFTLVLAIIIWFFLVPEPESIGIYIEEMTDKEMLIASAVEKDVFENVIRNSISEPLEVVEQVRLSQQFRRLSVQVSLTPGKISFWRAWMLPRVMLYS
jgi:hypothetical protein